MVIHPAINHALCLIDTTVSIVPKQGECVYKNLQMSQGVYFVTKGIAEAFVRVENESGTGEEERVKGIVGEGKFFGYSRFLAAFLEEDMAVRAFTQLYVSSRPLDVTQIDVKKMIMARR